MPRNGSDTTTLDYAAPRDPRPQASPSRSFAKTIALVVAAIAGFLISAIGVFYLVTYAFIWLNTMPRDEMSQGIMGSIFAVAVSLPLGVIAGVGGALLAVRSTRRLTK